MNLHEGNVLTFTARGLAVFAAASLCPIASGQDEPRVFDVQFDLDEDQRFAWPDVLADLAAGGATLACAGGVLDDIQLGELHAAALNLFESVEDPRGQWYVDFPPEVDVPTAMADLGSHFAVEWVQYAFDFETAGDDPPTVAPVLGQGYFWNVPHVHHVPTGSGSLGGHALAALRQYGSNGSNVTTAIIELAAALSPWQTRHEDLSSMTLTVVLPFGGSDYSSAALFGPNDIHHGTATLGIHCADQDDPDPTLGAGITGATPDATVYMIPFRSVQNGNHLPQAIYTAISQNPRPDVINMSLQIAGFGLPVSVDPFTSTAVAIATAQGTIVVEAAGNGATDLSGQNVGNDGALLVGALDPQTGLRTSFSNYDTASASKVPVCSWGLNVTTLGYGDASPVGSGSHELYTNVYNGTSSAAAITSALIACALDAWRTTFAAGITPQALQGSPSGLATDPVTMISVLQEYAPGGYAGNQFIGLFPDAQSVSRRLGLVPYGVGQSNWCGAPCVVLPSLRQVWFDTCAGVVTWSEPSIGGTFTLHMDGVPPTTGGNTVYSAIAISAAPINGSGPAFIDPTQILQTTPNQANQQNCGACGNPGSCGYSDFSFPIPNTPALAGLAVYFQGASSDLSASAVAYTNALKLTFQF